MINESNNNSPMNSRRKTTDSDESDGTSSVGEMAYAVHDKIREHEKVSHHRRRLQNTICICVDDFGLHSGIDRAALILIGLNRVHAVGCMVGGASWRNGSHYLRELAITQTDIGLHLDLTEHPILHNSRHSLGALIHKSFLRRNDRKSLRMEIRAQFDAFEQAMGRKPAFIDGHQHVHQFPGVRDELLEELDSRYGQLRPWLRSTRSAQTISNTNWHDWRQVIKPSVIELLGARGLQSMARKRGYQQNRHLLGVYDFLGGQQRYAALLAIWLSRATNADLLLSHPSLITFSGDPLLRSRFNEYQVLSGTQFADMLSTANVELRPISQILLEMTAQL